MLVDTGQNPTFYPGVYTLQKQMTSAAALTALQNPANKVDNTVVIPEGLIAADALQRIADATGISIDELTPRPPNYTQFGVPAEAPGIEGFLFPATYTFDPGVTAHDAIARMVNETFARLDALGVPPAERLQVLTLASVIQKESGPDTADMNKIARRLPQPDRPGNAPPVRCDRRLRCGHHRDGLDDRRAAGRRVEHLQHVCPHGTPTIGSPMQIFSTSSSAVQLSFC